MKAAFAVVYLCLAACTDPAVTASHEAQRKEALRAAFGAGVACIRTGQTYTDCDRLCWNLPARTNGIFHECSRGAVAQIAVEAAAQ